MKYNRRGFFGTLMTTPVVARDKPKQKLECMTNFPSVVPRAEGSLLWEHIIWCQKELCRIQRVQYEHLVEMAKPTTDAFYRESQESEQRFFKTFKELTSRIDYLNIGLPPS